MATQCQKVKAAAEAATAYNKDNCIKEDAQSVDFFKQQDLQVIAQGVEAFPKTVPTACLNSDYAGVWPLGFLKRINATKNVIR